MRSLPSPPPDRPLLAADDSGMARTAGRSAAVAWQEFRNKWECFSLFDAVPAAVGRASRAELVARAAALGPYRSLWATEGIGWCRPESLADSATGLPAKSLVPLHTGMGLALAARALRAAGPAGARAAVNGFSAACRDRGRRGYTDAAFEAIGLVARLTHPRLVPALGREFAARGPEAAALFWHGVGRGLYFAPAHAVPSAWPGWRGLTEALTEPPDDDARTNAVAGLSWAVTLVNVRHPEVVGLFLDSHAGRLPAAAFANGASSAALVWHHWAPDGPELDHLVGATGRWRRILADPIRAAIRDWYPELVRTGFGRVFRCRPGVG